MFLASNVAKVAVISGWNGLDGSMGPRGHVRCLDLVMEGPARCSMGPKSSLERVFFSLKSPVLRGFSSTFLASNVTKVAKYLAGMVHMDQWDLGNMSEV